jgi:hypothetical protein
MGKIIEVRRITDAPRQYCKCEFSIKTSSFSANPFDPEQIAVEALFFKEGCPAVKIPGFYYKGFNWSEDGRKVLDPNEEEDFRVRFNPTVPGKWSYKIQLLENGKVSDEFSGSFDAAASGSRGFIHVEPRMKRTFCYDNGELYIPIGQNVAWNSRIPQNETFSYFKDLLGNMADNGCNNVRIWLAQWNLALTSTALPPDDYSGRMHMAAVLDKIFEFMEDRGMAVSLVLWSHGQFSENTDPNWHCNSFNSANPCGYLDKPEEFFTDPRAKKDAMKMIRYVMARYGYSTSLFCYELFNELDAASGTVEEKRLWLQEMCSYIRTHDAYKHLVSNSTAIVPNPLTADESLDFIYLHSYNIHGGFTSMDQMQTLLWFKYRKPVLFGEFGILCKEYEIDEKAVALHQGMWSGLMGGGAGCGMNWFWNTMHVRNLYHLFKPIAEFSKELPLDSPEYEWVNRYFLSIYPNQVAGCGYRKEDELYIWLYDTAYTYLNSQETDFEGQKLTPIIKPGKYIVRWFDTYTGKYFHTEQVEAVGSKLVLTMPKWTRDVALIVKPVILNG